jgi:carbon monoxide dehydrogenase subunit G
MIKFDNTIRINRPVGEVFAFLSDLENLSKWNYYVLKVTKLSNGPTGIGSVYHQLRKTDEQDLCITALDQNRKIVVKTLPPSSMNLEMTLTFQPEGNATIVRDEWSLDSGLPAPVDWLGSGRIKSAVAENLAKLKDLLEEGWVVLQDGRQARL